MRLSVPVVGEDSAEYAEAVAAIRSAFDRVAPQYDDVATCTAAARAEDDWLADHISRNVGLPILDLGCGTGWFLDNVPRIGTRDYLGIDLSRGMLDVAQRKHPKHVFLEGDLLDWAGSPLITPETVFLGFGVIDFVLDPIEFVKRLLLGAASEGSIYIVFTTPLHEQQECACHDYEAGLPSKSYTEAEALDLFSPFSDLVVEPMPSPGHPGAYFVLTGHRLLYTGS